MTVTTVLDVDRDADILETLLNQRIHVAELLSEAQDAMHLFEANLRMTLSDAGRNEQQRRDAFTITTHDDPQWIKQSKGISSLTNDRDQLDAKIEVMRFKIRASIYDIRRQGGES